MPKQPKRKPQKEKREDPMAEMQRQVTEIRTALYGLNGTGGVVRETGRILEELKGEIQRLRDFRHDYNNHLVVFLDRLNQVDRRAATAAGALPFKALTVVPMRNDKERFSIEEQS